MSWRYDYYGSAAEIFLGAILAGVVIGLLIGLAFYLFQAIGLYQMSRRRGYRQAWLAFIPVVGGYVLGGVADNISACYGKKTTWRIWLLVLQAANAAASLVMLAAFLPRLPGILYASYEFPSFIPNFLTPILTASLFTGLLSLGCAVVFYIVLYRVFQDYSPNAVLFVVLSILFGIAPFFLFALRGKPSASLAYRGQFYSPSAAGAPPSPYPPQPPQGPAV